jgi:hypothetical protein
MKVWLTIALAVLLSSTAFPVDPTPTEVKTREWKEFHPQFDIRNLDHYVDYTRAGKVVFRTIERTVTITDPNSKSDQGAKAAQHIIEFVADGKVFATIGLDKANALSWTVITDAPVEFSSGFAGIPSYNRRFFYVCVPKLDYFEYLEVSGTDVKSPPRTDEEYQKLKSGQIKWMAPGYVHELDHPEPR